MNRQVRRALIYTGWWVAASTALAYLFGPPPMFWSPKTRRAYREAVDKMYGNLS